MTIIQGLIASISTGAGGGGPPPDTNHTFGYYVNPPNWVAFGGLQSSGNTSATVNASYTFPDNSTGSVLEFTGNEYYLSPNLGFGGAWANGTAMAVNIWFYPTANSIQIISECDRQDFSGYHYSMLEINSSGNVLAQFQNAPSLTSDNTVNLNEWNHIYFAMDSQGGKLFAVNNITTNSQNYTTRSGPGATSEYFIIGLSDGTNMGNSGRFQGKIGYVEISDYAAPSSYDTYKAKFGPRSLSFLPSSTSYIVAQNTQSDWNLGTTWTIEYWSKANTATTSGLYTVMCQAIDGSIDLLYQNGSLKLNNNTILFEPTPGVWTHVALVGTGSQVIAYYNGTSAGVLGGAINLNNSSNDLVIGRRGPGNFQYFDGNLAMIRISTTAKYSGNQFTPSKTYGVESDTRLMLGRATPLVDGTGNHPINNQGAVVSADFPT